MSDDEYPDPEQNEETTTVTQYASDRVVYCDWFRCEKCGCCDVMETFKFCPECGRKIE